MAEVTRSQDQSLDHPPGSGESETARRERLAELKKAIEAGTYRVSAELVAGAMLRQMNPGAKRDRTGGTPKQASDSAGRRGKLC